jgi:hypothetical protein
MRRPRYPKRGCWAIVKKKGFLKKYSINVVRACLKRYVVGSLTRRPGFKSRVILMGFVVHKVTLDHVSPKYFSFSVPVTISPMPPTPISPKPATVDPLEAEVPRDLVPLRSHSCTENSFLSLPSNFHKHGHLPTSKLSSPNPQNHLSHSSVCKLQHLYSLAKYLLTFYWHRKWKFSWSFRLVSTPTSLQKTNGLIKGRVYFATHVKSDREYEMFTIQWNVPIITQAVRSVSCKEMAYSC